MALNPNQVEDEENTGLLPGDGVFWEQSSDGRALHISASLCVSLAVLLWVLIACTGEMQWMFMFCLLHSCWHLHLYSQPLIRVLVKTVALFQDVHRNRDIEISFPFSLPDSCTLDNM